MTEMFEKFIADSISYTVLGFQRNQNDDELIKTHQTMKYIEADLLNFGDSINMLLTSIKPKRFKKNVLRTEICDFFDAYVSREIAKRKSNNGRSEKNVLQTFIDATSKNSIPDEFITAQVFTFFAGG